MKTRKIAYLGMLMALALVLSYVESLIPFAVGIPGVKLGLTNIVTVIMLYIAAPMETFLLCVFRAVLSGFMFGNAFSIIYSLAGCILSFIVMYLLKKSDKFSSVSISLVGGVSQYRTDNSCGYSFVNLQRSVLYSGASCGRMHHGTCDWNSSITGAFKNF